MENIKVYIFDSTNNLLGFVQENKLYDLNGKYVKDVTLETTIKQLRDFLLNQKTKST